MDRTLQLKEGLNEYLQCSFAVDLDTANRRQIYEALLETVKKILAKDRYVFQKKVQEEEKKMVYYMSMEFLMGRSLKNNLFNLGLEKDTRNYLENHNVNLDDIYEMEPDAGLGNGGLGRLAACYLDALTTQNYPVTGFSILYEFGIFKQKIQDGWQMELPDEWLDMGEYTLLPRADEEVEVRFYGNTKEQWTDKGLKILHTNYYTVVAKPYDLLISGYQSKAVNTLRLWSAKAKTGFDMPLFSRGEYSKSSEGEAIAESISKVLYPADDNIEGKKLRIKQQYFFVSASLQQILKMHFEKYHTLDNLAKKAAIHINDTHPSLCIPELMRILMDEYEYQWDQAWDITVNTCAYTNHTIMSEALEKWSADLIHHILPRIYTIIQEINNRFIYERGQSAGSDMNKMSVIHNDTIRMANLCMIGSHSVNGVSKLHSDIIKQETFAAFDKIYPGKFTNVTNGIAPRRWLAEANPELTNYLTAVIGDGFLKDLSQLSKLNGYRDNEEVLKKLLEMKRQKKIQLAEFLQKQNNLVINPDSIFDVQVKRLHEYKRQLLNALHITYLYRKIKEEGMQITPRTFIFGAKASAGYYMAKQIISYICSLSELIEKDSQTAPFIKVVFIEDYKVTLAEKIIPAAEISEQISQAGKEASGTGNMKFMLNGAVTLGTMDGANVEIYEQVGADNILIFGMSKEQVNQLAAEGYESIKYYREKEEIKKTIDFIRTTRMGGKEFIDIVNYLLHSDPYMNLADFESYVQKQHEVQEVYKNSRHFAQMMLSNIANAGIFSADRSTREYADRIWKIKPVE